MKTDPMRQLPDWLEISDDTANRLAVFTDLVKKWNPAINLVSKASVLTLWDRHVIDSAQLIEHLPKKLGLG